MYGAIGTGNVRPGFVTVSLGTSGTACTIFKRPYCDPEGEIASYCDAFGNYMALLCVMNLANGYNQMLRDHGISHGDFERLVRTTPPGNGGLALVPWYTGERTPNLPNGAPFYFGFGLDDFTVPKLCRAVLEGHVMNLYEGFLKLNVEPEVLYLTGGIAQSLAWRQTIADVFGCRVAPVKGEGAALGAAVHAAWVDNRGAERDLPAFVRRFVEIDGRGVCAPQKRTRAVYDRFRKLYAALSRRLRGLPEKADPFELRKAVAGAWNG
jgi:xylulokinase